MESFRRRSAGARPQVLTGIGSLRAAAAVLASLAHGVAGAGQDAAANPAQYEVVRAASQLDEELLIESAPAWAAARSISWGEPGSTTTFRALAGEHALVLRFDVIDAQPWSTLARHDDPLWREEVVEIFIAPAQAGGEYVELQINPAGVVADLWIDLARRSFDSRWDFAGLQARVQMRRDGVGNITGWCALASLPWSGFAREPGLAAGSLSGASGASGAPSEHAPPFGRSPSVAAAPKRGERWRFNVFRIERPGGRRHPEREARFLAWSATHSASFHVPEAFAELVFP